MTTSDPKNSDTGSTFLSHTHIDDAGGRFAAVNAAKVVGEDDPALAASYPACSPGLAFQLPDEPPYENPELPAGVPVSPPAATGDPAVAPLTGDGPATSSGGSVSEPTGSPPSSPDDGGFDDAA